MTLAEPEAPLSSNWSDVRAWRKRMREQLLARRLALKPEERHALGDAAKRRLRTGVDLGRHPTLGLYWPIRGEVNVRELALEHIARGGRVGLPVVVARAAPVEFWNWVPGAAMERGLWDIPVPAVREVIVPDALVIPLVGFDAAGYRLGYGGGYYDRTLAASRPCPLRIGLGYEATRLRTIYPQPHDIAMNLIVTEQRCDAVA